MFGVPHMYTPRLDYWNLPSWTYAADNAPYRKTLQELLDWDQIRDPRHMRLKKADQIGRPRRSHAGSVPDAIRPRLPGGSTPRGLRCESRPEQPTRQEINVIRLAWEDLAA